MNLEITHALEKTGKPKNKEKIKTNELYVEKLLKTVHFLACNNLPFKESYPKKIKFLSDETNESVIKQYLET